MRGGQGVCESHFLVIVSVWRSLIFLGPFERSLVPLVLRGACSFACHQAKLGPPGGGTPHRKGVWTLVVSLRGVNFGFWSHSGCSGQNAIMFSGEGLV